MHPHDERDLMDTVEMLRDTSRSPAPLRIPAGIASSEPRRGRASGKTMTFGELDRALARKALARLDRRTCALLWTSDNEEEGWDPTDDIIAALDDEVDDWLWPDYHLWEQPDAIEEPIAYCTREEWNAVRDAAQEERAETRQANRAKRHEYDYFKLSPLKTWRRLRAGNCRRGGRIGKKTRRWNRDSIRRMT